MCHIFFIHSSVDGHLGCFHVLAIVAAMNIVVHDSSSQAALLLVIIIMIVIAVMNHFLHKCIWVYSLLGVRGRGMKAIQFCPRRAHSLV